MRYRVRFRFLIKIPKILTVLIIIFCFCWWLLPFNIPHPEYDLQKPTNVNESKITDELADLLQTSTDPHAPLDVIARLNSNAWFNEVEQTLLAQTTATKIKTYHRLIHAISLSTTGHDLQQLTNLPEITKIWADWAFQIDPPPSRSNMNFLAPSPEYITPQNIVSATPLYDLGFNGSHTVVSILDTGIDATHPDLDDLDDNETTNDPKVLGQVSFAEGDPFPFDLHGHGTYCAGLVAGTGALNRTYAGIAPGAQLLSAKVLLGDGTGYSSWVIRGIEWSITNGADIILLPFSTFGVPGDPLSEAVRIATEQGVLVIAASGDRGPNHLTIMSPGESIAALTVGAYDAETGQVPDFSSRGPTFDMRSKPDLVAPGVNVISTSLYHILPTEIGNISIPFSVDDLDFLGLRRFGTPINNNYSIASTTAASAAITSGVACLLLQGCRYATPECLSIGMRQGASLLQGKPNIEGAGLLNATTAYSHLGSLHDPFPPNYRLRSVTSALPYYGILMSGGNTDNVTLLATTYSSVLSAIVMSTETNMTMLHTLMGMFHLAIGNNTPIPFALLNVEQELHWTTLPFGDYVRATGVLSYNDLLIIPRIETWRITTNLSANAFRFTFFFLNIGPKKVAQIRLYSLWNFNLFTSANETSPHIGTFNNTSQLFHVFTDTLPPNETTRIAQYLGLNYTSPLTGFEVGPYQEVSDHLQNETLNDNTSFTNDTAIGFGSRWDVGDLDTGSEVCNVSMTLGLGHNFSALVHGINVTTRASPPVILPDLCMIRTTLPRTGTATTTYTTNIIALNIGDTGVDSVAAFLTNRTQPLGGAIFARYFQLGLFNPFHYRHLTVEWDPEFDDIYFAAWAVSPEINLDWFGLSTIPDLYPLDNLVFRDVFISSPPQMRLITPSDLPYGPMTLRFPGDYAVYNLTLLTSTPIEQLTISIEENVFIEGLKGDRNTTRWAIPPTIIPEAIKDIVGGTQFQLTVFIPTFLEAGPYYTNINVTASNGWHTLISLVINVTYPKANILFDSVHNTGLDFSNIEEMDFLNLDLESLLSLFEEMSDSILTGYSRLRELFAEAEYNLTEIPYAQELNSSVLSFFDGVILCDPERGFSATELENITSFINDGLKVLILADNPELTNHTALNQLLASQGLQLGGTVITTNTSDLNAASPFTQGLTRLTTLNGTFVQEMGEAESFAWVSSTTIGAYLNSLQRELFIYGSSAIFSNTYLGQLDNQMFANQTIHHLFRKTTEISIRPTGGNGTIFTVGKDAGFVIDAVNSTGHGVESLEMYVIYRLSNGSEFFFIGFEVKEGRYGTFLFANWTGLVNGTYSIIVFTSPGEYCSRSAYMYFSYIDPEPEPEPLPDPDFFQLMVIEITIAIIVMVLVVVIYFVNQYRRHRRMRTPTLDEQTIHNIDNALNTTHALIREMEWTLTDRRMDRLEKLRSASGEPANRLDRMLARLRELAKETGA